MNRTDVEMEDTGKLLEDEVVGRQESVEHDQLGIEEVGGKHEESPGLANTDIQNPNGTPEEHERPSKKDEEETHPNQNEQELTVDETQDSEKDDKAMDDDKLHDSGKEDKATNDDKTRDSEKDEKATNDDKTRDGEKDDKATNDDKIRDGEKDDKAINDDKIRDGENDAKAMNDDKVHDSEKDDKAMDDDKILDSEQDATAMYVDHGVLDEADHDASMKMPEDRNEELDIASPNLLVKLSPSKAKDHSAETPKNELEDTKMDEGYESGTAEDQETFMKEVEAIYKEKSLEFKPPKFYGQPLNCLKLWRSVIKLGGYDRVTGSKLWRQVGESFHPPKTCTTVSWTFRQFYEKALLEYERHKMQSGELELPLAMVFPEAPTVENEANGHQTPGSGRARRDAAARAMQGWHSQRLFGYGEEKNSNNSQKREKSLKSIGSVKQKRPNEVEHPVKAAKTETSRQLVTSVCDVGPPADWVKINVRETKDSFEVYALVPGLLREEVRVQSDPAGRLVITGQPEQPDNPWGITAFKKVISLPSRIDPLHTSAIVSLHGRLLVRVPFEQSNI